MWFFVLFVFFLKKNPLLLYEKPNSSSRTFPSILYHFILFAGRAERQHQLKPLPVKIDDIFFFGCIVKFRVNYLVKSVKILEHFRKY